MATEKMRHSVSRYIFVFTLFAFFEYSVETDSEFLRKRSSSFASEQIKLKYDSRTFVIDSENFQSENGNAQNFDPSKILSARGKGRNKRDTSSSKTNSPSSVSVQLNDSHTQMIVHWAGAGSQVIIALSRSSHPSSSSTSNLFISYDYGTSFENMQYKLTMPHSMVPIINHYYNSRVYNSHYIFTDIIHNYIFTTLDYGRTFSSHSVPFTPTDLKLHASNPNLVLGMNKNDTEKKLYLSEDFGYNWRMVQQGVVNVEWGEAPYDNETVIYVERQESWTNGGSILSSNNLFRTSPKILLYGGKNLKMEGPYMFATKTASFLFGGHGPTKQLWVSYKRQPFVNTQFSENIHREDYYVADASEEQVFLVVTHNLTTGDSNLYISDVTGSKYSKTLDNIVYFNPEGAHSTSWLRHFAKDAFVDLTKIKGLKGVYIASQLTKNNSFQRDEQRSMITFDKGGEWSLINPPAYDINGNKTKNCTSHSRENCSSLHLTQEFSRLYPGARNVPILSRESAPGIIMATGIIGQNLKDRPDVYVSSSAGYQWRPALEGSYFYAMGDHGGLLVAVPQFQNTKDLLYSWDEGETWNSYTFHNETIRVYGVLTEPGEATAIFSIFGSHLGYHKWLIIQVNMDKVFRYTCKKDDYKMWSFPDNPPFAGCILGKKLVIERRIAHAACFNGRNYDRTIVEKNCSCTREDYECAFGFHLEESLFSFNQKCIEDPDSGINIHKPPSPCPPGTFYPYSRGYQKIPGDTCQYGEDYRYDPLMYSCPVAELPEFLIYVAGTHVHRVMMGSNRDEIIYTNTVNNIVAAEFDLSSNCMFVGMASEIQKVCFGENSTSPTTAMPLISTGLRSIESLAFDWSSKNLYWVDAGARKIEVAREDGRYRKELFNSTYLDRPRALVLDPRFGYMYWTDWSASHPRIVRAWMDGTHNETIVSGYRVHWPNGITIDFRSDKIYWTDAYKHGIYSANSDGQHVQVLKSGSYYIPHPYSIGVFKNNVYWADWTKTTIMTTDKDIGLGLEYIVNNTYHVSDLKIYSKTSQSSHSLCTNGNGACTQLCLPRPQFDGTGAKLSKQNRTCACNGNSFKIPGESGSSEHCKCGEKDMKINGVCVPTNSSVDSNCSHSHFTCSNGRCIPATWLCDRDDDCRDGSDEFDCPYLECSTGHFQCKSGACIPDRWRCDHDNDCDDGSDEENCEYAKCTSAQFSCDNKRCIPRNWTCDYDDDCHDNSDEKNCHYNETCSPEEFHCAKHQPKCVPMTTVCDGHNDCVDGSDEVRCNTTSCPSYKWACADRNQCIYNSWRCDGEEDCNDGSDEKNCTTTTTTLGPSTSPFCELRCSDMRSCYGYSQRCDGIVDCWDSSDEIFCPGESSTTPATTKLPHGCSENQFYCYRGHTVYPQCIPQTWVCDNTSDCENGEDEDSSVCKDVEHCASNDFRCLYMDGCVPRSKVCDGKFDCLDASDEMGCALSTPKTPVTTTAAPKKTCPQLREENFAKFRKNYYTCDVQGQETCGLWLHMCDWTNPCYLYDNLIVSVCNKRVNVTRLEARPDSEGNIRISWEPPTDYRNEKLKYIVSYLEKDNERTWVNTTQNLTQTQYVLKNVRPVTTYEITVYVIRPNKPINFAVEPIEVTTLQEVPFAPGSPTVSYSTDHLTVIFSWVIPPGSRPQDINRYKIYWKAASNNVTSMISVPGVTNSFRFGRENLEYMKKYQFWVTAVNQAGEGKESKKVPEQPLVFDDGGIITKVNFTEPDMVDSFTIKLHWMGISDAQGYRITYLDAMHVPVKITVQKPSALITNLCPGLQYEVQIAAYNNHGDGPSRSIFLHTNGTTPEVKPSDAVMQDNTKFLLSMNTTGIKTSDWVVPGHKEPQINYTVYYAYDPSDLEVGFDPRTKAKNITVSGRNVKSVMLVGLRACESYVAKIAVTAPGICPLSNIETFHTGEDIEAQPENLKFEFFKDSKTTGNLTWDAACSEEFLPVGYVVIVTEDLTNKSYRSEKYNGTRDLKLSQILGPLKRGGVYTVVIQRDVKGARNPRPSDPMKIYAEPYGGPLNLIGAPQSDENKITLSWTPNIMDAPDSKNLKGYELQYMKSHVGGSHSQTNFMTYGILGGTSADFKIEVDSDYHFRVRVVTNDGYRGAWSQEYHTLSSEVFAAAQSTTVTLTKTNLIAIIVSITTVVIALVVVLAFFIIRHRRLQRSFMAFANSHYDSRSGTTTFTANDIGEEEDSPMIRGFSDDEPLVIA